MAQTKVQAPFVEGGGGSSFKNLLINGDMQIWQRATAATAATGACDTVDRWKILESSDGAITSEQSALSTADKATTGCRNALLIKCTTTDSSIASGQYCYLSQGMEGQFLSHLGWGTTSAKTLTLSFWVKAYVAGTYSIFIKKYDNTAYHIPIEYTVDSSNTWEKKIIVISPTSGSTSLITGANGAFDQDNGLALLLGFNLAWGSTYHGTSGTWASGAHFSTSNQTNFLSSTSNTFYLTGVQLEVGDLASDLEHIPHDVQLQRCQRYLQNFGTSGVSGTDVTAAGDRFAIGMRGTGSATTAYNTIPCCVTLRATPSITSNNVNIRQDSTNYTLGTINEIHNFGPVVMFAAAAGANLTVDNSFQLRFTGSGGYFRFDAEL